MRNINTYMYPIQNSAYCMVNVSASAIRYHEDENISEIHPIVINFLPMFSSLNPH